MDRPEEIEFTWLMLIGISLMFFLALAVVVFLVYYQRKLYAQKMRVEQVKLDEQKKRLDAVIQAQESERWRIARDLHDEVGVMLSTVKLYLTYPKQEKQAEEPRQKAEQLVDEAVAKLRQIAQNLSSEHLQQFGLVNAIEATLQPLEMTGALVVEFEHNLTNRLGTTVEVHLYRIIQELLNNTVKHAQASTVTLVLKANQGQVNMSYQDDGKGFEISEKGNQHGLGLKTLASRVELLQGDLQIDSAPGKGIRVTIDVATHQEH